MKLTKYEKVKLIKKRIINLEKYINLEIKDIDRNLKNKHYFLCIDSVEHLNTNYKKFIKLKIKLDAISEVSE